MAGPILLVSPGDDSARRFREGVVALERKHGGRLGVAAFDAANERIFSHRGDERFLLCSTHKLLSAAFVLARVDRKEESLDRRVIYAKESLVAYSPVTEKHVREGMTMGGLCEAAITLSDNTAANLLFESFGGPPKLTAYVRSLGDRTTRSDRREPELNDGAPRDERDTTTPRAMLRLVRTLTLGDALSAASRVQLAAWLVACQTGDKRLRAGMPEGWRVGDKTGSGNHRETNDVAVAWRPDGKPLVVAAYYAGGPTSDEERSATLAAVGRLAVAL